MGVIQDILRTMDYGPSPEGAEHVKAWLEAHRNGFGHFINGAFTKPGHLFDVFNPATGERIARASQGSPADINGAIAAARKAQVKWAASTRSGMSATRPAPAQVAALSAGNLKATWTSATAPTGPNRKPARSCAAPRKSKTSGPLRRVGEAIFLEKPRYVSRTV
jgi:hypothetical protein